MATTSSCRIHQMPIGISAGERPPSAAGTHVRRPPGGVGAVELWSGDGRLTLVASGDVDALDRHAVVDLVTDGIVRGARHVRVDGRSVTFIDIAALRALSQRNGSLLEVAAR